MPKFCHSCGAALVDRGKFCPECGVAVNAEPPAPQSRFQSAVKQAFTPVRPTAPANDPDFWERIRLACRKLVGLTIGAVVVAGILVYAIQQFSSSENKSDSDALHRELLNSVPAPEASEHTVPAATAAGTAPELFVPPNQKSFTSIIESFIPNYHAADTEIRKTNVRFERKDAIVRYFSALGSLRFEEWIGKVEELRTESDGEAAISIKLNQSQTIIKTWNNSFSDSTSHTMISRNDGLYPSLMNIRDGEEVTVSGTFILADGKPDYVEEASLTEAGSMTSPEFIVRFTQIGAGARVSSQGKTIGAAQSNFALGVLENVECDNPALDLNVLSDGKVLRLHASNYFNVQFSVLNVTLKGDLNPCKDLEGRTAKVEYVDTGNAPNQLLGIEIHR